MLYLSPAAPARTFPTLDSRFGDFGKPHSSRWGLTCDAWKSAFSCAQMSSTADDAQMRRAYLHDSADKTYLQEVMLNSTAKKRNDYLRHNVSAFFGAVK